ncbi:phage major capsid protein [Clostridium niameyense]|uniref:Phage major capsid protein n=1 Tax=Clostridium niameyense TaxID=1622073 RepID=A0A6M0RDU8_9CLOT|nr:phage major capsid protein [Clostridium niameyense]NEZ47789.1 phage major capsid protein [Clostridium niameyense]
MAEKSVKEMIYEMNNTYDHLKKGLEGKASAEEIERMQDALDNLEAKMQNVNFGSHETKQEMTKEDMEYKSAFDNYIRTGATNELLEKKAMSTDSNPDGGYLINPIMANKIIERVREVSPIRQIANIVQISNANEYKVPKEDRTDLNAGWVGERENRPETATGKLQMVSIPLHEQYAQPGVTRRLLTDSAFAWEGYISKKIFNKFARMEGQAFVNGDGVNKPKGFLYEPEKQGIQVIEKKLDFDGLIDLQSELLEEYLAGAQWVLNRFTLRDIRKLKNTNGDYIWQPSTQVGAPSTILEYGYKLATDMPIPKTGEYSVAFGNFKDAYTIVDGAGMYMLRDEYTKKPNILFYTTRRVGGGLEMEDAIKVLKQGK